MALVPGGGMQGLLNGLRFKVRGPATVGREASDSEFHSAAPTTDI